jgi:hypothetical protein
MRRMASAGRKSSANGMSTSERKRLRRRVSFAVCIENAAYPASLELHKIYRILPDEDAAAEGDLRVIDESGEDYLYPAEWFAAVDLPPRVRTSLLRRAARLQSA